MRVNQTLQAVIVCRACWHLRRGLADVQRHAAASLALAKVQVGLGDGYFLEVHGLILCPGYINPRLAIPFRSASLCV